MTSIFTPCSCHEVQESEGTSGLSFSHPKLGDFCNILSTATIKPISIFPSLLSPFTMVPSSLMLDFTTRFTLYRLAISTQRLCGAPCPQGCKFQHFLVKLLPRHLPGIRTMRGLPWHTRPHLYNTRTDPDIQGSCKRHSFSVRNRLFPGVVTSYLLIP